MRRLADMTAEDVKPVRIALTHQHRSRVQRRAGRKSQPPQVQAHSNDQGECAVEDRERPRRSAHKDRLGQCHMERNFKAFDFFWARHGQLTFRRAGEASLTTQRRRQSQRTSRRSSWP